MGRVKNLNNFLLTQTRWTKIPIDSKIEVNRIGLFSEKIISVFPSNRNEYYKVNDTIKNATIDTIPQFSGFSTAANAVVGVGNMMLQKEIISKLDTVIALLKEKD